MKSNSKETNRIKEPSKFSVKFANTVFVLGILFSVLVAVYAVYKIYNKPEYITLKFYFSFILFAVLSTALFVLGLRKLRDELKVNMSVLLITVGISVYGFETYLEVYSLIAYNHQEKTEYRTAIAEQMGITYDNRSPMEVLENLKASGINAYANVFPTVFIESNGLKTVKGMILPLGGISNISTILSNETGYYPKY